MTDTNTPRPSADEIRELVERVRKVNRDLCESGARSWTLHIPPQETDPDLTIEALCAAVESLLEDRELLDGLERALAERPPAKVYVGLTVSGYETLVTYGPKGHVSRGDTLRAALKQAVGA